MNPTFQYGLLIVFILLIALEWAWSVYAGNRRYNKLETLGNFVILLGNQALKPLSIIWAYLMFEWIYPVRIFDLPVNGWTFAGALLIGDFLYYWHHRLSHELTALWTLHHVHHSSPWMNFSTAFRIHWLGKLINPIFFVPAILLGFAPEQVALGIFLNLAYQFFLHTEWVGKLGWLEGWVNTPSAHRAHHGSNDVYIDKNYGGFLMIWDRMFGTYQAEVEKAQYGVTTGFVSHNPLVVLFRPVTDFIRGRFRRERQTELKMPRPRRRAEFLRIFIGAILALGLMMIVTRQSNAQDIVAMTPEQRADSLTRFMKAELNLTASQISPAHKLNLKYARLIQREVLNSDRHAVSKIWKAKALNREKEEALTNILTLDQMQKFKRLRADMREEMMPVIRQLLESKP